MAEAEHAIRLVSPSIRGGTVRAECSCGWCGPTRALLSVSAALDGEDHKRRAAGEGDT